MKLSSLVLAAGVALAAPAFAQTTDTWRMPHERGFWGHAGASFGASKFQGECPSGFNCDDKDQFLKAYAGGRFNNTFGLELGVMNFGKFDLGGGETDGWGADLALIAGIPIGANSSIFAKVGAVYARMDVTGSAPGFQTGKERGFGARWGVGAQVGLTQNWAVRADYDRYRVPLPGDHEDIDTLTLGLQYTFR